MRTKSYLYACRDCAIVSYDSFPVAEHLKHETYYRLVVSNKPGTEAAVMGRAYEQLLKLKAPTGFRSFLAR